MERFKKEIDEINDLGLMRNLVELESTQGSSITIQGKRVLNFGSNNYLGLANNERVKNAFKKGVDTWGTGAGASRLVTGNQTPHRVLEEKLAEISDHEESLLFPCGYMANLGVLSTLPAKDALLIFDKLNHASLIDGAYLSKRKLRLFSHKNYDYLEKILSSSSTKQEKWVFTDSLFSMDGDFADFDKLLKLKKKHHFYLVADEAHSAGVFGRRGGGVSVNFERGLVDIKVGTLSKAFGLQGGYVAASSVVIQYLKNKCRNFIYTTGISPALCEAALEAISIMDESYDKRKEFIQYCQRVCLDLQTLGLDTLDSKSQIIPIKVVGAKSVKNIQEKLLHKNIFIPAMRFPTVKKGGERLRLSLMITHKKDDVEKVVHAIAQEILCSI